MECRVYLWVPVSLGKSLRPELREAGKMSPRNLPCPSPSFWGGVGGVAAGDALREEEEVSLQLCGGHLSGQPGLLTPSPSPLSGSEPGKGVGTLSGGRLKNESSQTKASGFPPPSPAPP